MDFRNLATQVLMSKIENANNSTAAGSALDALSGKNQRFDLVSMVGQFSDAGGDLATKTRSWLADGQNDAVSPEQIREALGAARIDAFAAKLGLDRAEASDRLAEILPELIDKSSQGGSLLGSRRRAKGLAGLASRLFK